MAHRYFSIWILDLHLVEVFGKDRELWSCRGGVMGGSFEVSKAHAGCHVPYHDDHRLTLWNSKQAQINAFFHKLPWLWCLFIAIEKWLKIHRTTRKNSKLSSPAYPHSHTCNTGSQSWSISWSSNTSESYNISNPSSPVILQP